MFCFVRCFTRYSQIRCLQMHSMFRRIPCEVILNPVSTPSYHYFNLTELQKYLTEKDLTFSYLW